MGNIFKIKFIILLDFSPKTTNQQKKPLLLAVIEIDLLNLRLIIISGIYFMNLFFLQ